MEADELRALYTEQDEQLRQRWARSLSFQDGLLDRWERAARLGWGSGTSIYNSVMVLEPVTVGDATWIGPWVLLDGSGGGLRIGSNVDISAGVHVYTHDTVLSCLSGRIVPRKEGAVSIGDCTYVGPGSVIVGGVSIGHHCVIGAGSFVNHDVPDRSVVAGSPATLRGRVVGEGADVRIVTEPAEGPAPESGPVHGPGG